MKVGLNQKPLHTWLLCMSPLSPTWLTILAWLNSNKVALKGPCWSFCVHAEGRGQAAARFSARFSQSYSNPLLLSKELKVCIFHLGLRWFLNINISWAPKHIQVWCATYCRRWVSRARSSCCWWGCPRCRRMRRRPTSAHARWSGPSGRATAAAASRCSAPCLPSANRRQALCRCRGNSAGESARCTPGRTRPSSGCKAWTRALEETKQRQEWRS